jgi:hypothetical protein
MRKVLTYTWVKGDDNKYHKIIDKPGLFHKWGVDFEEFESGPGNYSTAIIEMEDGTIENIRADMIKFIDSKEK